MNRIFEEYLEEYKKDSYQGLQSMKNHYDNKDEYWWIIEELLDRWVDLQANNQKLNDQLDRELIKRTRLEDRIKKAIDYVENDLQSFLYSIEYKTLLDILKGEE